jgi:aminoglycoside 3-N-acetyltransferase I
MNKIHIKRLTKGETELARSLFLTMASVFGEGTEMVSAEYAASLLNRDGLWAIAALRDGQPIAGLTAFVLPLTRSEITELFIYDIAVVPAHQRLGIGRQMVEKVRALAAESGMATTWMAADNDDTQALDFYRSMGGASSAVTVFTFA